MRLRFTPRALAELEAILATIAEQAPQGARRVEDRIRKAIALLVGHPMGGQQTSNPRLRRIVVRPYPYLIFYEVIGDEVVIIAVRHGARDPATMPGGANR